MDKFEKHIKEKFQDRRITPSPKAWEEIASRISTKSKQGPKKWYAYAIAASFIGLVVLSIFFFQWDEPTENLNKVVEENGIKETVPQSMDEREDFRKADSEKVEIADIDAKAMPKKESKSNRKETAISEMVKEEVMEQLVGKMPIGDSLIKESDDLIAQKVTEVVAQVEHMEALQFEVGEAEVDSLLRAAQKQIIAEKLFTESGTVDAMTLLAEVEDELDESFRDQIFDALKVGYFKLRTAVADRNN
ncbi:MAG: hypothetical protein R2819_09480 [Allomuricauda sp.]